MMLLLLAPLIIYSFFFLLVFEAINVSATRQATGNVFKRSPILSKIVFGDEEMKSNNESNVVNIDDDNMRHKTEEARVDAVLVSLAEAAGAFIAQQPDSLHSDMNAKFRNVMREAIGKYKD